MYYQLTYIIPSDVADAKTLEEIISDINKKITDAGGVIKTPLSGLEDQMVMDKSTEELEKIKKAQNVRLFKHRLGYPIKKVSYGFYVAVVYELPEKNQASATKRIDAEIRLNKRITRFVTTKYNFEVFSEQSQQKEKSKNVKIAEKPEAEETKEAEPLQAIVDQAVQEKKDKKEVVLDEKPKRGKKTEIEELDEKLEQILNA
jgi:ribosomal protein S6